MQRWTYKAGMRLRSLLRRGRVERELADELNFHLEQLTAEGVAKGMTPESARYAALRELGGAEQIKEECRDTRRVNYVETFLQDLRYALRQLRRNPDFACVAVLTLALGIGANTAIFSVVDTVLLRPLPYRDPSRLVWATERFAFNHGAAAVISPDFMGWREHNQVFEQIGASGGGADANLTGISPAVRVGITNVTPGFFPMLGVKPLLGRTFLPAEGQQGNDHVAVLSETLWRNRFGADPRIAGKNIRLDDTAYTVVGVMPATLRFPSADLWTPFALDSDRFSAQSPRWAILTVIGRLKPGVGIEQAQSDLQVVTARMDKEYPPLAARFHAHERTEVIPLHEMLVQNVRPLLLILMAVVGFVLLIACANVANLLLARGVLRGREMAVRVAIGAGRTRLVRQMLTEGLLLAAAGGVIGILAGFWGTRLLTQLIPSRLPSDVHVDLRVLAFSAGAALVAVLVFGLVPALTASRVDAGDALKEGGLRTGASPATHRLRSMMSIAEIALSLILLAGAGLLMRSFLRLSDVELGFDPHGLLIATVERPRTSAAGFGSSGQAAFFQSALERIRSLPGVKDAAVISQYPLGPPHNGATLLNVQGVGQIHLPQIVMVTAISPDYFRVMKIRVLKGRVFGAADAEGAQPVAVVNESLARILFKDRDPVGQHVGLVSSSAVWMEVTGVVSPARNGALEDAPGPELFVPYLQQPAFSMTFMLRTASDPRTLAAAVRSAVQQIDKNQPVSTLATMDDIIADSLAPRRFKTLLLGVFALLALALAIVGIYGDIAYFCGQRTHEFGVRVALGAERKDIFKLVVGQAFRLALAGVAIGVGGALGLTRFMSGLLYGVKPADPPTLIAVALILTGVALLAGYVPARRAIKADPMAALRHE